MFRSLISTSYQPRQTVPPSSQEPLCSNPGMFKRHGNAEPQIVFLRAGLFSVTPFSEPPIDGRALVSLNDPLRRCPMLPVPYPASSRPKQSGI